MRDPAPPMRVSRSATQRLTGLPRLRAALRNSCRGLADAWRCEEAFRIEAVAVLLSIPAAAWLGSGPGQVALLVSSGLLLLVVELVNTAIEATIDRIGPERNDLSRMAKDLGSAAVLVAALIPLATWGSLLAERLGWIGG